MTPDFAELADRIERTGYPPRELNRFLQSTGITRTALARRCGVNKNTVIRWAVQGSPTDLVRNRMVERLRKAARS